MQRALRWLARGGSVLVALVCTGITPALGARCRECVRNDFVVEQLGQAGLVRHIRVDRLR